MKSLKSLKKQAEKNANAVKKKVVAKGKTEEEEVKKGTPLTHAEKQKAKSLKKELSQKKVIGMNIGITRNLENYESLRIDCWLSDFVEEDDDPVEIYERLSEIIRDQLEEEVDKTLN